MIDRTIAPPLQELKTLELPFAEVSTLANGTRFHSLINHTQPVARLEIVFNAGKWYEPSGSVSLLTSKMLLEGTSKHSAKQIADTVAFYGANLDCSHGYDKATLTLYCLSRHLESLLPLVIEIITSPTFPEEEFTAVKKRLIQNVRIQKEKTSYLATERLTQNVFGKNHPYTFGIDEQELQHTSIDAVKTFYKAAYTLNNADVFFCGSATEEQLSMITDKIGSIKAPKPETKAFENKIGDSKGYSDKIVVPGSVQSSIRVGCISPLISNSEYPKYMVLNEILGGYFGSRLMKNIREEKGFTYGIFSTISPKLHESLFYIGTDVNGDKAEETLTEIYKEIEKLQKESVPEAELQTVKNYMAGKFLNDINTIFDQCDKYKTIVIHNLQKDFYQNYLQQINETTSADIKDLANVALPKEKLFEVVTAS